VNEQVVGWMNEWLVGWTNILMDEWMSGRKVCE